MAVTAAMQRQGRFSSISVAGDREKAFREARRHSFIVRSLRRLLPVAAILCVAVYALPANTKVDGDNPKPIPPRGPISDKDLIMQHPRVKGTHPVQGEYDIRAEFGKRSMTDREHIQFEKIDGDLHSPAGEKTVLTAPSGIYKSKAEVMNFDRGLNIVRSSGLSVTLKAAVANFREKHVISTEAPVEVRLHDSHIRAESMELFVNESRVVFSGNVSVHLERLPEANPAVPAENAQVQTAPDQLPPR
jgi:lipopolysaccharide export system protein LptC